MIASVGNSLYSGDEYTDQNIYILVCILVNCIRLSFIVRYRSFEVFLSDIGYSVGQTVLLIQ